MTIASRGDRGFFYSSCKRKSALRVEFIMSGKTEILT